MSKRLTTSEFIERARKVHGDKYDYSKVEYIDASTKVCIICPKHGDFWQVPSSHLNGIGCKTCSYEKNAAKRTKTTEEFIKEAIRVHGDKYDYSKVVYRGNKTEVCIICPKHGEFWQTPDNHMQGRGCHKCANSGIRLTTEEFIERAKKIHGNKYDYSKVEYINAHTKVTIICPIHGEFKIRPYALLHGQNCPKCSHKSTAYSTKEWIEEAKKVHDDKYDYSKVEYVNNHTKVCIICPIHGEFWQRPLGHLMGKGCPNCHNSKLENQTSKKLEMFNISFINRHHFDWLGLQHLDFYLPQYNIAIECQGMQHFKGWGGKIESLKSIQKRDKRKKQLCEEHGVKLYYINYDENVETKLTKILKEVCHI